MTSQIRFEPSGATGLVASGTTLAAAAERLGVPMALECGGAGECTSCAVRMRENPFALSEVTEAERRMLGEARLFEGLRLACQARVREGDCTVEVLTEPAPPSDDRQEGEGSATAGDAHARVIEAFEELPTAERLATAIELQVKVAGDLLETIIETPLKMGEQVLSSIFGAAPAANEPPSEPEEKKEEASTAKSNGADQGDA
jgi:ferredoxin